MAIPIAGTPVKAVPDGWYYRGQDHVPAEIGDPPEYEGVPEWIKGILIIRTTSYGLAYSIGDIDVDPETIQEISLEEAAEFAQQYPQLVGEEGV